MEKIENWETVEARGMEDFKTLPAGAYVCKIVNAVDYVSEQTGNKSLKVMVDIADGEFKDYFKQRYDNNQNADKKWDNNACKYLGLGETGIPFFKGFITSVENSNAGYTWNWDEKTLRDKKICGVFSYEEYEKQDGTKGVKVRLNQFRSLDKMKDVPMQDRIRLLSGEYMSIDDYNERLEDKANTNDYEVIISDDELPF